MEFCQKETSKKQIKLNLFCKEYDMSRSSVLELIRTKGFPAYKIGGRWYIDTHEFIKWRNQIGK